MRSLAAFVLLFVVAMLVAALLLPPLYWVLGARLSVPPHLMLDQLAKLVAVPFFLWLLARFDLLSAAALGLRQPGRGFWREAASGWLWGVAMLGVLCALLITLEARSLRPLPEAWAWRLAGIAAGALVAGFLIAWIEEVFFRGGLYGAARRESGVAAAIGLSSVYYAALHFVDPRPLPPDAPLLWDTGLHLLAGGFWQFSRPGAILDSFSALFAAGVLLAMVREQRRGLAFAIGLHAGWILVIRLVQETTRVNAASDSAALVGAYNGIIGYFAAVYILALVLLFGLDALRAPRARL